MKTRDTIREFFQTDERFFSSTLVGKTNRTTLENVIFNPPTSIFESVELVINFGGGRAKYFFLSKMRRCAVLLHNNTKIKQHLRLSAGRILI